MAGRHTGTGAATTLTGPLDWFVARPGDDPAPIRLDPSQRGAHGEAVLGGSW